MESQTTESFIKNKSLDVVIPNMFINEKYRQFLFYATMISQCKVIVDTKMEAPAGVSFINSYNLYINPLLFDEFTLQEQMGVLTHEMLHIMFDHVHRREDRNALKWNYATDCAINQLIPGDYLPQGAVTPQNYPVECGCDESADYYYELLKDLEPGDYPGHEKWEESTEASDLQREVTKKMIEKSISETSKFRGVLPSNISSLLSLLNNVSEISWKTVLRNIVSNKKVNQKSTIMRKSRRFLNRPDIKGKTKDKIFSLLVIADVSGSVSDSSLISMLSEIHEICILTKVDVNLIQVDTEASDPEKFDKSTKIIERKASGGTFISNALNKAKEFKLDYQAIIVLTDGYLASDDIDNIIQTQKRVIWLVDGEVNGLMNSPKSTAFNVKKED